MSKCRCCGEEIGDAKICPICGTKVVEKKVPSVNVLQAIEEEKSKLIEKCAKSVTKVIKDCENKQFSGTGWVIKDNLIVTNAHVICENGVYDRGKIFIEFNESLNLKPIEAKVLFYSVEEDIAILTPLNGIIPSVVPTLEITDRETRQGELVFTIGNPLHYKFTYTEGAVANPHYMAKGSHFKNEILQTTLTLNSGNSGGSVFDASGKVVGMTTFSESLDEKEIIGYGFCVKSNTILKAIKQIKGR